MSSNSALPPVMRHSAWRHLLHDVGDKVPSALRGLLAVACGTGESGVHDSFAALALAPVAALARTICVSAPDLLKRPQFSVLVITEVPADVPDDGRWFRFLPAMLGYAGDLRITIICESRGAGNERFDLPQLRPWLSAVAPVEIAVESLSGHLAVGGSIDFAFALDPAVLDVMGDLRWTEPDHLPELLARGAIVGALDSEWFHAAITAEIAEAHGLGKTRQIDNPFWFPELAEENDPSPANLCSCCWSLSDPPATPRVDHGRIASAFQMVERYALAEQDGAGNVGAGLRHHTRSQAGSNVVIGGLGSRGVDVGTGGVYRITEAAPGEFALLATGEVVGSIVGREAPGEDWSRLRTAMWADAVMAPKLFPDRLVEQMRQRFEGATTDEKNAHKQAIAGLLKTMGMPDIPDLDASIDRLMNGIGKDLSGVAAGIPLFVAVDKNDATRVRELIAGGESPDEVDGDGWTPLNHAASINAVEAAQALIEGGATVDKTVAFGFTPLETALYRQRWDVAITLMRAGASTDRETPRGSIREFLASSVVPPEVVTYLETEYRHRTAGSRGPSCG